jgi:hypothetical protein
MKKGGEGVGGAEALPPFIPLQRTDQNTCHGTCGLRWLKQLAIASRIGTVATCVCVCKKRRASDNTTGSRRITKPKAVHKD